MTPTHADAKARATVRLRSGRLAELRFVPGTGPRRKSGDRARVVLPDGAWLSVPVDELEVVQ